jgi:hypothetical protein
VVSGGTSCDGKPCWKALSRGYRYRDRSAAADGIYSIQLKEGPGKSKLVVKAKGAALQLPPAVGPDQQFAQDPRVVVQLVNANGSCWDAAFSAPAQRNEPGSFKDRSD